MTNPTNLEVFYELSSAITGYSIVELLGTGVGKSYFETIQITINENLFNSGSHLRRDTPGGGSLLSCETSPFTVPT